MLFDIYFLFFLFGPSCNPIYGGVKMETINTILESYEITSDGFISSPGKFEGEPRYAPYFWDLYLNGAYDGEENDALYWYVEAEDIALFPELQKVKRVFLSTTDQGFVCVCYEAK